MNVLSEPAVEAEIERAEAALDARDARYRQLWNQIRVRPAQWDQTQYPRVGPAWVVGLMDGRCLYFNAVEGGWGWGRFKEFGEITEFHTQKDALADVIARAADALAES